MRRICERTANRLARLARPHEQRPAFAAVALRNPVSHPAFAAALGCPDAFLFNAPSGPDRLGLAIEFTEEALALGQRVLVVAEGHNAGMLVQRFNELGYHTSLCSTLDGHPTPVLPLLERRIAERERANECLRLEAPANEAAEKLERLEQLQRAGRDHDLLVEGLERELEELQHPASPPAGGLGGFVKKLFGSTKAPAEHPARIAAIEEQLKTLIPPERVDPKDIEAAAAAHRAADAAFARAIAQPVELAPETVASLQVVVATFDAFDSSKLLADEGPRFDRLLIVDGEDLAEDDFLAAAARAEAWVLFGNPEADGYFTYLWMNMHSTGPWQREQDRLLYRLAPGTCDSSEPLCDRPEIELRFLGDRLVGIAFPTGMGIAEAKQFVATELGEVKLQFPGTGTWTETAERIEYLCPALTGNAASALEDGITESVRGEFTVGLTFDKSQWNRDTAEAWRLERSLPQIRTAILPKPFLIA